MEQLLRERGAKDVQIRDLRSLGNLDCRLRAQSAYYAMTTKGDRRNGSRTDGFTLRIEVKKTNSDPFETLTFVFVGLSYLGDYKSGVRSMKRQISGDGEGEQV